MMTLLFSIFLCLYPQFLSLNLEQNVIVLNNDMAKSGLQLRKNAVYEIRETLDLQKAFPQTKGRFEIPKGCVLKFTGGKICHGTIVGNDTRIETLEKKVLFSDVDIRGTYLIYDIYIEYMDIPNPKECGDAVRSLMRLQNPSIPQRVFFPKTDLAFTPTKTDELRRLIDLKSNTKLYLDANISVNKNDVIHYEVIRVNNQKNVEIHGNGHVLAGDVEEHVYTEKPTYGIGCSIYGSTNVRCYDLTCIKFTCDGFYIGGDDVLYSNNNITIDGCKSLYNRRQGLSVICGKDITIKNSEFSYTGTLSYEGPGCGIDFEPNTDNQGLKNVTLKNCTFRGNYSNSIKFYLRDNDLYDNIQIDSCYLYNETKEALAKCGISINNAIRNFTISNSLIPFFNYTFKKNSIRDYGAVIFTKCDMLGIFHWNSDQTVNYTAYFIGCTFGGKAYSGLSENDSYSFFTIKQHVNMYFRDCVFDYREIPRTKGYRMGYQGNPDVMLSYEECTFFDDASTLYGNHFENNVFHNYAANLSGSNHYPSVFKGNKLLKGSNMNGSPGAYIGLYGYNSEIVSGTKAEISGNQIAGQTSKSEEYNYPVVIYRGTSAKLKKVIIKGNTTGGRISNATFEKYLKKQVTDYEM